MRRAKKIGLALLIVLVGIQLIHPAQNVSGTASATAIASVVHVPQEVAATLKTACYDCHSNNTQYPWYASLQPVGWYLAHHIKDGKRELNFDEFAAYPKRKQERKLKAIASEVVKDDMPLSSYTLIHKDARLTVAQKAAMVSWARASADTIAAGE